ncbi:putative Molybdenum cofactor carrier [Alkalidesulfovibrio alkalitolerans DSM 16529]|jgi:hypothetical protein|uniref:Putative Molybdenum cofactor carrier n=1 Tax=Alkalidesulfovibrio alkalitolerans DSM 16529 TaxID=1121439 RepID=S7UEX5_9BACT|nr:putative molybdenum carrier protein [Alkalidesulfovibrio alkalitolerans]EPR32369.1 putative Molybdenum cofactor carrier [Alkalidesulfovibrio alkalitolerans DSM 16529]
MDDVMSCPVSGQSLRILSGGQTGVDRAALDVARALGLPHGGWCPRGRLAEDGVIPACYDLRETLSGGYGARTERNIAEADATLILTVGELTRGTALTRRLAKRLARPHLVVDLARPPLPEVVRAWLLGIGARSLNVAGSSESKRPGIHALARAFLHAVLLGRPANGGTARP